MVLVISLVFVCNGWNWYWIWKSQHFLGYIEKEV